MQALAEKAVCAHIEVEADQPMQLTVQHHPTQPPDDEFIVYLGHNQSTGSVRACSTSSSSAYTAAAGDNRAG
eukprot:10371-Heterococcus_DN1.PRE.3